MGLAAALVVSLAACAGGGAADEVSAAPASPAGDPPPTAAPRRAPSPSPSAAPTTWPRGRLPDELELGLEVVADGLDQPVFVTAPAGDDRLYVVEKVGRVRVVEGGRVRPAPFLDVRRRVLAGGPTSEQGMFALAFHPDHASNGRVFVHYTARPDGDTRVEEYRVAPGADRVRPGSRRTILRVDQPFRWHNGGMMMFGPDGMLWLGLGDGGVKNDPDGHGQDPRTLLGSLLRIDVDRRAQGRAYGIPPDNPFPRGRKGAPEVWAYGLRNPWRFDIDPRRGLVFIADVGEYRYEEINVVGLDEPGRNFGWAVREGDACFPGGSGCLSKGLRDPVLQYAHEGDACAIVGGAVYRGSAVPELAGRYFYADFCAGRIRSVRYTAAGRIVERRDWSEQLGRIAQLTSFGVDAAGELYVTSARGTVLRLVRA